MLKSTKTLVRAACLTLSTLAAIGHANASAGAIVRPEPIVKKKAVSKDDVPVAFDVKRSSGDIIRSVNAGKSVTEDAKETKTAKTKVVSKTRHKKTASKRTKSTKKTVSSRKSSYTRMIQAAARKHGVPIKIAKAVVQVESNFNPSARGGAGEVGLMQIKPATARGMGYRGSTRALYDPETNLEWGMKYLAGAHKRASGDVCGTILRYNAGHYAKRMNPISRRYCSKVKTILASS
ncbi:lytic transglycosylase domain-containing protein [Roseibium polysiphoniae]|nr:lytic transglycosylase domain-containing protein [Roseibium polysiphoniae]